MQTFIFLVILLAARYSCSDVANDSLAVSNNATNMSNNNNPEEISSTTVIPATVETTTPVKIVVTEKWDLQVNKTINGTTRDGSVNGTIEVGQVNQESGPGVVHYFKSLFKSKPEYGTEALITAPETICGKLDKVQNAALRVILGASRSTPITSMEMQADIEPLAVRREIAAITLDERLKRLPIKYWQTETIGENCTSTDDCEGREVECQEGLCQCKEGYAAAIDRRHCLKIVHALGEDCIQDAQCSKGLNLPDGDALCVSFRCVCGTDTIHRDGTCLRSIYLGDSCQSENDCLTMDSHCMQGVCACPEDMVPSVDSKQCLRALKTLSDSNCTQDAECQQFMGDSALCTAEGTCKCSPRTHFNSTVCVPDITSDCYSSEESETEVRRDCIDNRCVCAEGFSELAGQDICVGSANIVFSSSIFPYLILLAAALRMFS
uniref:EB domain-containing protein n=1 Tax=Rhodnius prolixus TaxID=13249 RepID=T1HVD3_RHOPR